MTCSTRRASCLAALAALAAGACDTSVAAGQLDRCALGARAQPAAGESLADSLLAFEDLIGRRVDLDRQYGALDDEVPGAHEAWSAGGGRTPLLSIASHLASGEVVPWAAVADPDDPRAAPLIDALIERLRAFDRPILVIFHDQPEEEDPALYGGPDDYLRAWRRVVEAARAAGADNATWVWALGAGAFPTEADAWYPGDEWVDWLGVTGFNAYGDGETRWRTFPATFAPFRAWSLERGRPLLVVATASTENPYVTPDEPRSKPTWIREALATLEEWPEVQGLVWFNGPGPDAARQWSIDSTSDSLDAFRELATSPLFDTTGATPSDADATSSTGSAGRHGQRPSQPEHTPLRREVAHLDQSTMGTNGISDDR